MKNFSKLLVSLLLLTSSVTAFSQKNSLSNVDEYVQTLGSFDTLNMGTISAIVTRKFSTNLEKSRAIFCWIANNITFDLKAAKNNNNEKSTSDIILKTRKANSMGYATLFQDMCSVAKIRCLTVDGYVKNNIEEIIEKPDEFNHTWAVIQLGQSPDTWFYVDPTWGSGYTDEKMKTYTKKYNPNYFFSDKTIFNFQHFPDNISWQLGLGAKDLKNFTSMPMVKSEALAVGLSSFTPANGILKTKLNKPVQFSIKIADTVTVEIVSLTIGNEKKKKTKTVDYKIDNGKISFSYKFEEEDECPVTVLINNQPVICYYAEITE
ncbi:MAG: transglutaminase domain-containing protein [Bacteroidota bacterium]